MNCTSRMGPAFSFALLLLVTAAGHAQVIRPHFGYKTTVSDQVFIRDFLKQQSLPVTGNVDSLEFIDADGQGFGENDLVIVYPSQETYPLTTVEEPSRSYMANWKYAHPHQFTGPMTTSNALFSEAAESDLRDPLRALLAHVLRGLEQYYGGANIEGRFRQDSATVYLELWNFDPEKFQYRPSGGTGAADTVLSFDLLQVVRDDTLFLADSTLYDILYVYKTIYDTVYIQVPDSGVKR